MRGIRGIILVVLLVVVALSMTFVLYLRSRAAVAYGPALALCPGPDKFGYTCADGDVYSYVDATNDTFLYVDDGMITIDLPFPFTFYDQTYEEVNVSSNGNLQFSTSLAAYNNLCLNEAPVADLGAMIAPYWDDLDLRLEGFLETEVVGEEPNRIFVIEWDDVPHYGDESGASITFEVQLFEGSNDIVFLYADVLGPSGTANGASATVGIQEASLGITLQYTCNQPTVANPSGLAFVFPDTPNTNLEDEAFGPAGEDMAAALPIKGDVAVLIEALQLGGSDALPELRLNWLQATPARQTDWYWIDLTGDGVDELVYLWRGPQSQPLLSAVAVLAVDPAGGYTPLFAGRLSTRSEPAGALSLGERADITGDGRRDVLLPAADGHLFLLTYDERAGVVTHVVPGVCQGSLGVLDANGDDRLEIVRDNCVDEPAGRVTYQWVQGRFIQRQSQ